MADSVEDAELFREFFNSSLDLLCVGTMDGGFQHLNPYWTRVLGYSLEELKQRPFIEFVHPEDRPQTVRELQQLRSGKHETVSFQNRYRTKQGRWVWLLWSAAARGAHLHAVARDITALKTKEEFLRNIQQAANIGGWTFNVKTGELNWTDETYRIHGLSPGAAIEVNEAISCYDPEGQQVIRKALQDVIEHQRGYRLELPFTTTQGKPIWIRTTAHPYLLEDGEVVVIAGTLQEITDFKAVEFKLEDQRRQLHRVIANSPGMVFEYRIQPRGRRSFNFVSVQAQDIYGVAPERFQEQPELFERLVAPEDQESLRSGLARSAETLSMFSWQGRLLPRSGKVKWIKVRASPHAEPDGSLVFNGLVVDVTRDKLREHELRKKLELFDNSARLATLGEMAAGVGHEINNPLSIADGNIERLGQRLQQLGMDDPELNDCLEKYQLASSRIAGVVKGLRSLVMGHSEAAEAVDLVELVEESLGLVGELYQREGIDVRTQFAKSRAYVHGNRGRLQQVLMNFLSNSKHALAKVAAPRIEIGVGVAKERAFLSVEDNGAGISGEDQARVFESFFTTKHKSQGTGLGLSLVHNIVKEHEGHIELSSEQGTTRFTMWLPSGQQPQQQPQATLSRPRETEACPSAQMSVLLVDDEPLLRDVLVTNLRRLSFEVDAAESAQGALELAAQQRFDFIVTDLQMPGMDGLELARALKQTETGQGALLIGITGGVNVRFERELPKDSEQLFDGYLYKPFKTRQLVVLFNELRNKLKRG